MRTIDPRIVDQLMPSININIPSPQRVDRSCRVCSVLLAGNVIECPECGAINLDKKRIRSQKNRPKREIVKNITSTNHNGKYSIYKNSDGSLSCNCLSFLFQKDVVSAGGVATCKHIRVCQEELSTQQDKINLPSDWQIASLKRLGVEILKPLTNDQAYFIFFDLLNKQGVNYKEYERLLRENQKINTLPIYSFGIELEGLVQTSNGGITALCSEFERNNLPCINSGYTHASTNEWKIVSDSSILPMQGYTALELVSPKLFGAEGFAALEKGIKTWHDLGGMTNRSCGTHVHIDAWNWDNDNLIELAKIWTKIEQKVLWYLVSPSRRNSNYCRRINRDYLAEIIGCDNFQNINRFYSLNLSAFARYKTVEIRLHNGTLNAKKIIPWVIFLLKLTDSVKKGLKHTDINSDPAIEDIFNLIGMDSSATSVIKNASDYLKERYEYFKRDVQANPSHMPDFIEIDLENLEETALRESIFRRVQNYWTSLTVRNISEPENSLSNLASRTPSRRINPDTLIGIMFGSEENSWQIPSTQSEGTYTVTLDNQSNILICSCRGFRNRSYCYHSVNVARYLLIYREEVA